MPVIVVATGTSQHKLEFAVQTIESYFKMRQLSVSIRSANVYTWDIKEDNPDVVVLIGPQTFKADVPVISGVPFITKIGMEKACAQIEKVLRDNGKL